MATAALDLSTRPLNFLRLSGIAVAGLAVLPLLAIVWLAATQPETTAIPGSLMARYAVDTLVLAVAVGAGAVLLGSVSAWLVVMYRFPGRDLFAWTLALPLACPGFVLAYAYADMFDVAGPLRSWLRLEHGIAWFPFEMRSLWGASFVLACAFYPYVYLTARAAFTSQSICALESARMLGASSFATFRRVALPLARPAIAAGAALAVMETIADFGAVQFLGVQTLTTGIVRAWSSYGAPGAAARLALMLMGAAILLLWIERLARSRQRFGGTSARWRLLEAAPLSGIKGWGATLFCAGLLTAGLLLPVFWLAWKALGHAPDAQRLFDAATHSLTLAAGAAVVTVALATLLAFGTRANPLSARVASLGYATPGVVIAVGLLGPVSFLWQSMPAAASGFGAGIVLLVYAYSARLMAAALEPIDAGLTRVPASMERASRSLGESEAGTLRRVHMPLMRGSLLAAALLVFIDVLKELPATLILRPFDFDTLAVLAHSYASDERLMQAAWPSLILLLLALGPVAFLSRKIAVSRPGAQA